jgi:uncharacterized protein
MRVVLDTNVLFSALIKSGGVADRIYQAWRKGSFELVTGEAQFDEIRRASRYPKFRVMFQPHRVGVMINHMQRAIVVEPAKVAAELNDDADVFLLGLAESGQADWLVTGDRRAGLLTLQSFGRTRIATPAAFADKALNYHA